ncbi:Retrovirus-related Pol polyprotein from transposon TNT 1-94 [Sesamum angolense]|uniref:Retrovirus-related Pol polyprotein from transposon TNT 1-94 n=1 Tax=Sesamum angolense TaxID=2727404 RepID=A0AAE2C541_9LAMI|nr:Retrovirus-related Pol polyprotein from transposon TNT 1-94 [Sesamum angolense]
MNATSMSFLDPCTNDSELEISWIIHLQSVANRLPDAFIDTKKVTKSHIPAENVPTRLEVPKATLTQTKASESQIRWKRGRPLGSKNANSRKRKEHIVSINHDANVTSNNISEDKIPEVVLSKDSKRNEQDLDDSYEMSINYAHNSLGTTKYCLGLQFEHTKGGVFIHQLNYIENVLKRFHMNNANPLSTPMVVRSLDVNKDLFRPPAHNDEILGPEVPNLSAIGALMCLANNTRPDIAFSVNLLARYCSTPTKRHWNGVKHILRYLRGTSDMDYILNDIRMPKQIIELVIQMRGICLIRIKLYLNLDMYSCMVELLFHGVQPNRLW